MLAGLLNAVPEGTQILWCWAQSETCTAYRITELDLQNHELFLKNLEIVKITLWGLFLLVFLLWSFGIAFFTAEMMQRQVVFRAPGKGAVHQWVPCKDFGAHTAALFSSELGPDYWGRFVWAATSTYQIHPGECQLMHGESGPCESCRERAAAGNLELGGDVSPLLLLELQCGAAGRRKAWPGHLQVTRKWAVVVVVLSCISKAWGKTGGKRWIVPRKGPAEFSDWIFRAWRL